MDLDTVVHRDSHLAQYSNLFDQTPYADSEGFSSSSHIASSGQPEDHFMAEGSSSNPYAVLCSPFYDPFDPFQSQELSGLNAACNPFAEDGHVHVHGSQGRRFLDVVNGDHSGATTMEQYQLNEALGLRQVTSSPHIKCLEKNSRLVLEGANHQITCNGAKNKAKETGKRRRIVDKKSEIVKGQWTSEEDGLLVELVEQHGVRKWSSIAQMLPGRIGKQCRERWHNHLKPNIKKDRWSEEEDRMLIEAHRQLGNRWAEIARSLPGRSENTIKNHWNATKRRQLSSRKNSSSKSSSPLQDYIKSVISNSDDKGYMENSSSGSASPADSAVVNTKPGDSCSELKPGNGGTAAATESFELLAPANLDAQMHMQFDLQKEMDFMEMLSYGYI